MTDAAAAPYRIIRILPEWILEEEAMGSKQKFWFRRPGEASAWLFKYPQQGTGQHWAEKIAAEIAAELAIFHAKVELARFRDVQGSATESFARKGRELFHGNQVLAGQVLGYDPGRRFRQSSHTLANIFSAIERAFRSPQSVRASKVRVADYLVLDALIGNTDRHHENWGVLRKRAPVGWTGIVAPSFDHASSLGRELRDESAGKCRQRILAEGRVGQYAENAPGAIYWEQSSRRGVSPLELVRRASVLCPEIFRRALSPLDKLKEESFLRIVDRVPAEWMSPTARRFAIELLCYNLEQPKEIAP